MKTHKWEDVMLTRFTPAQIKKMRAEVKREILEADLRAMRELAGKTQAEVAKAAQMTQGEISRVEKREDHLLSMLRRYVEALGGELEVRAVFGDKTVRLKGV
jgi:predicted transcriptional regulator